MQRKPDEPNGLKIVLVVLLVWLLMFMSCVIVGRIKSDLPTLEQTP